MSEEVWTPQFGTPESRATALNRLEQLQRQANGPSSNPASATDGAEPHIVDDNPIPPRPIAPVPQHFIEQYGRPTTDFDAQQAELDALEEQSEQMLENIRQRKLALAESRKLKIEVDGNKVILKKENAMMTLTRDEILELCEKVGPYHE